MKKKRWFTMIGSICLSLVLAALLLPACAPAAPEAEGIAELEDELAAAEKEVKDLKGDVSDLEKKLAKAEAAGPVPIEPEYKIALAAPMLSTVDEASYRAFVDLVNIRGEGRIEVTFFPEAVLGSEEAVYADVAAGAVEMTHMSAGKLTKWVPWASIGVDLPFVWTSWFDCYHWWEQVCLPEVNKELVASDLMTLPYVGCEGVSHIWSRVGPIRSVADVEGKIFRAYSAGTEVAWMEAMGGKGTVLPWAELYTALETGIIDLMHNPFRLMLDLGFADVTGDVTITGHKVWVGTILLNLTWWNSLPEDIQIIIDQAWYEASPYWKWANWTDEKMLLEEAKLPPYNLNIYTPTATELAGFKAAVEPVYDWARQEYGSDKVDMMLDYSE